MPRTSPRRRLLAAFGLALLIAPAAAQQGTQQGGAPAPGSREAMWPAPTEADWAKPCLITWQRTYEDALQVSQETGKPILVCVNMDGEIASEHYAGIRYRQPDKAALYEPYVCVIASTYRHTARDYDEDGQRVLCPRFGSVTCEEHISIEPGLFDKFFEGQRVAPRHVAVELDSAEIYDVYYAFDTDSVFDAIRDGVKDRPLPKPPVDDRSIVEKVESPDIVDRIAIEDAYREGDLQTRRDLVQAVMENKKVIQVDLLRLAVFDTDAELRRMAWNVLAQTSTDDAIDLLVDALRAPVDDVEREGLIGALDQLGESAPRARTLATVHRGLANDAGPIDVDAWRAALAAASDAAPTDPSGMEAALEQRAAATEDDPDDPHAQAQLAEGLLSLALHPATPAKFSRLMVEDAREAARRAEELGATGWTTNAVFALLAEREGNRREAYARAEAALAGMPADVSGRDVAAVMELFAQARHLQISRAIRRQEAWPGQWLTDMHAAYHVLAMHPSGNDGQVRDHHDILMALGAYGRAAQVLEEGLAYFPDSWILHDRLRGKVIKERGIDGLDGLGSVYEEMIQAGADDNATWFAGYASLVAAEFHRRAAHPALAGASYGRAIEYYERSIAARPEGRSTADHYIAMALAGRARLALEAGELETSLADVLASFERAPQAAATLDGMNLSAVATAQMLLAQMKQAERSEPAARLQEALDSLDPVLLRLPAFESVGPGGQQGGRGRRNR